MQVTYAYPLVPIANLLSGISALIPLPWLLQHWNTGAWAHGIWGALASFITGVNTILWAHDAKIKAIIWCDITVRVYRAASLAVITSSFTIARRVSQIMSIQNPMSEHEKWKVKLFDLFFSIGVPVLSIPLSWFTQGHRFNIYEGFGCDFAFYETPLALALYWIWIVIFGALAMIYSILVVRALTRRRNGFYDITRIDPEITPERFRRVYMLAIIQCTVTFPLATYVFADYVANGVVPWKRLDDAHYNFSRIAQVPATLLDRKAFIVIVWNQWVCVFNAFFFFLVFGVSKTMWEDYWKYLASVAARLGIKWPSNCLQARAAKIHGEVDPPMVFNVHSTLLSSTGQSTAARGLQSQDEGLGAPSDVLKGVGDQEEKQVDIEKGLA